MVALGGVAVSYERGTPAQGRLERGRENLEGPVRNWYKVDHPSFKIRAV